MPEPSSELSAYGGGQVTATLAPLLGTQRAIWINETLKVRNWLEFFFLRSGYPEMRRETRRLLQESLAEEVQKLSQLCGRDLSHWK